MFQVNPLPIQLKFQVLFTLKKNEKIFINVLCCSRDWHLRVKSAAVTGQSVSWVMLIMVNHHHHQIFD